MPLLLMFFFSLDTITEAGGARPHVQTYFAAEHGNAFVFRLGEPKEDTRYLHTSHVPLENPVLFLLAALLGHLLFFFFSDPAVVI